MQNGTGPDHRLDSSVLDYVNANDLQISDVGFFGIDLFIEVV